MEHHLLNAICSVKSVMHQMNQQHAHSELHGVNRGSVALRGLDKTTEKQLDRVLNSNVIAQESRHAAQRCSRLLAETHTHTHTHTHNVRTYLITQRTQVSCRTKTIHATFEFGRFGSETIVAHAAAVCLPLAVVLFVCTASNSREMC
jgi:hypothetical protein